MKKQTLLILVFLLIKVISIDAQTPNRTPEQIKEDSIAFEKLKKEEPEVFLNKRLPIKLLDGNYYVKGFNAFGIRIVNNYLVDSVNHNFHLGSTEKNIMPYNNIQLTEEKVSIDLIVSYFSTEAKKADSAQITLLDTSNLKKGYLDGKHYSQKAPSSYMGFISIPPDSIGINKYYGQDCEIRISLNGKLLFDWKKLTDFPKNIFKSSQKWPPTKFGPFWIVAYGYGFHIADQNLALNEQLLVEIKDTKNGWMLDRFNFTRVSTQPKITHIIPVSKNQHHDADDIMIEKKTLL